MSKLDNKKTSIEIIFNGVKGIAQNYDNINDSYFNKNIKYLRESNKLSQENVGKIVNKERSTISLWERNERFPSIIDVIKIASYFSISTDALLGIDLKTESIINKPSINNNDSNVPVFKTISDKDSLEQIKDVVDWEQIPTDWLTGYRKYFSIKVQDNSMAPNYLKGDTIIFQTTNDYINDNYYLVKVGNDNAVFRKVIKQTNGILLQSINSDYETNYYTDKEIKSLPINILGIAKELRRKIGGD